MGSTHCYPSGQRWHSMLEGRLEHRVRAWKQPNVKRYCHWHRHSSDQILDPGDRPMIVVGHLMKPDERCSLPLYSGFGSRLLWIWVASIGWCCLWKRQSAWRWDLPFATHWFKTSSFLGLTPLLSRSLSALSQLLPKDIGIWKVVLIMKPCEEVFVSFYLLFYKAHIYFGRPIVTALEASN